MSVSPRVADRIGQDFRDQDRAQVLEYLRTLDLGEPRMERDERICAAIVLIADGDVDRLVGAVALAERDWRDVLVAAGLANEDWRDRLDDAFGPRTVDPSRESTR